MKKSVKISAVILCLIMLLPTFVFGYAGEVEQNPAVSMPKATPVIDGTIEYGAWSDPAYLNDATSGRFWDINEPTSEAELYFAYDDNGLYFAADITDSSEANGFVPSTGYDDIDNLGTKKPYGFNGDVMSLMLDPLGVYEKSSYQTTAWYNVGIFSDNTVKVYRSQVNEGDITSSVSAKGSITEDGWCFETYIPWSIIVSDVSSATGSKLSVTQAKLATVGSVSRAACMYMDRYYTAGGSVNTWGRFITVCEKTYDGYSGTSTSGVAAKAYGITLNHTNLHEHLWSDWTTVAPTCTAGGSKSRVCTTCGTTESETLAAAGHKDGETVTVGATCTENGSVTTYCSVCNAITFSQIIKAEGHSFGDWQTITEATETANGLMRRECSVCGATEDRSIPMLSADAPVIAGTDNYTVTINGITDIKEIRFAIGTYTTGSQVKAAEKNVTMDAATVAKYTVDGVFTYDLPWVGTYTFWVRAKDGSSYFLYTDITDITPYVTSYGVKLTVNDFGENYKDAWLAEGTFNSYNEIKASANFKYQASANKLANYAKTTHDFSYTMTDPGPYTVLIRYNDDSFDVIHHTLTVDYPVLAENGLQAIITNIPDIKIIRTAYGHHTSVSQIKAAAGVRNFSNKNDIKNADSYTIQYREEGEVTLIVEYNNGYKHFFYYNVVKKTPTFELNEKTVTFGNLSGMTVLRYAPGEYSTSSEIKNAPGSQYIRGSAVENNTVSLTLENGTYSFVVQYNDDSYFYKTVTISDAVEPTVTAANVSKAFSSNMMFQRDEPISVWGWSTTANEGKIITATLGDMFGWTTVKNGEWKITFPETLPATTEPLLLTVNTTRTSREFRNILIGDVYYVIGQSNVFYGMANQVQEMQQNGLTPNWDYSAERNIRFFRNSSTYTSSYTGTKAQGTTTLLKDVEYSSTVWMTPTNIQSQVTNPPATGSFSALGYLFAYNMSNKTDVPIGVIEIDASGFPLIAFAPNELASKWGDESYNATTGVYTYNLNNGYLTNPNMPTRFVYNHLIYPLRNFATSGIIWYQGESDCVNTTEIWGENADTFSHQFTELMNFYRRDFANSDFPVYMIEFPTCFMNGGANAFIDMGGVQCEQGLISGMLSDFHLVNSSDMFSNTTWYNSLHPYIKEKQADRLANIVAANGYGVGNLSYVSGPVMTGVSYSGTRATVTFKNVGSGLKAYSGGYVDGFDVYVNIGGTYQWVEVNNAYVSGTNQVIVPSSYTIYGVRYNRNTEYLFPLNGINLCNSNNVPASAFIDLK
ncbi:MAG: hypothetical protein IJA55_10680 [Clostridia bacterium]|nr:hypothetical protein [Clostridia bacterium]